MTMHSYRAQSVETCLRIGILMGNGRRPEDEEARPKAALPYLVKA